MTWTIRRDKDMLTTKDREMITRRRSHKGWLQTKKDRTTRRGQVHKQGTETKDGTKLQEFGTVTSKTLKKIKTREEVATLRGAG